MDFDNVLYDYINIGIDIVNIQSKGFIVPNEIINKINCFNVLYNMRNIFYTFVNDTQSENIIEIYNGLKI